MITLLLTSDAANDPIDAVVRAAKAYLIGPIGRGVIWDAAGDDDRHLQLRRFEHCGFTVRRRDPHASADGVRAAWSWLLGHDEAPYVFHLDGHMVLEERVDLAPMVGILVARPDLAQLVLRRRRAASAAPSRGPFPALPAAPDADAPADAPTVPFISGAPTLYRRELMRLGQRRVPAWVTQFGCAA